MNAFMEMWVVTDHPEDMPDYYVARRWVNGEPTQDAFISTHLERVRAFMEEAGLYRLERNPEDDPVIIETWL